MARKPCRFRERDIARAVRGARSAGIEVGSIEIDTDGKIVVNVGRDNPKQQTNTADRVLQQLERLKNEDRGK